LAIKSKTSHSARRIIILSHRLLIDRQTIASSSHVRYDVVVNVSSIPLQVTLSYLDPAAAESAAFPPFTDLNLIVVGSDGSVSYGNDAPDVFATNEKVIIESPVVGTYKAHVTSTKFAIPVNVS
jgi:hypothetical protein